ncbi:MAG: MOSC domain-containing protein [Lutibacter sp.]
MQVVATNIGTVKQINYKGKKVITGIYKFPVTDPIFLGNLDVANDAVIDRRYHGGIDQAVYLYGENHYKYWQNLYPNLNWHYGMFGENLTVADVDETKLKVGTVFQLGDVLLEVTKPRTPCSKLAMVFDSTEILKQFWNSTKSGFYCKVLKNGFVKKGDVFILKKEDKNKPTIAEVYNTKK